jgi:hypothetical protein
VIDPRRLDKVERALAHRAAAAPVPRLAASDDAIHALVETAVADTAAGRGYPPDLDRVRQDFERDVMEEGSR